MITETTVCALLHCSRCNEVMTDDDERPIHFADVADVDKHFPVDSTAKDVAGWRRIGDRILCPDGTELIAGRWVEVRPLPAAESAVVLRAQTGYAAAARHVVSLTDVGWTIRHPLTCRPTLFDCSVNAAAERDLTDPPAKTGLFVCDVDSSGAFVVLNEVPA